MFRDLSSLPAGSSLESELFDRLDRSTHLIVLACAQAALSDGMEMEARHWFSRPRDGQVLIIITSGKDAAWPQIRDRLLPPAVRQNLALEPLWVSIDRRRDEILANRPPSHLPEALTEDLKQVFLRLYYPRTWEELRGEERTQRRRAIALTGGAAMIFLGLATAAFQFARDARQERDEAMRQAEIASARQFTAQAELLRTQSPRNLPTAVRLATEALARYPSAEIDSVLWRGLVQLPALVSQVEHGDGVGKVRYTPDGCCVVTASLDGSARIIHAASGREIGRIQSGGKVWDVALDPTGQLLATASADGAARITEWRSSQTRFILKHTAGKGVRRVLFSPDGKLLATGSEDGTGRLWDVRTGKEMARVLHRATVWDVAFSPNGRFLATGGRDNSVRVWDCLRNRSVSRLAVSSIVWNVVFSVDGRFVAVGTDDGLVPPLGRKCW